MFLCLGKVSVKGLIICALNCLSPYVPIVKSQSCIEYICFGTNYLSLVIFDKSNGIFLIAYLLLDVFEMKIERWKAREMLPISKDRETIMIFSAKRIEVRNIPIRVLFQKSQVQ